LQTGVVFAASPEMQPAQIAPIIETDDELQALYNWVDEIQFSRPKRNISRDFADGVLVAEVVNFYFPKIVEMHNYSAANSHSQKMYNWNTLNQKVLKKLGYQIHQQDLEDIIKASPGAIERVLKVLQEKIVQAQNGGLKVGRPSVISGVARSGACAEGPAYPVDDRHLLGAGAVDGQPGVGVPRRSDGRQSLEPQPAVQKYQAEVGSEILGEKEQTIAELREMVTIMSEKIKKLEQLVRIKDSKIEALTQKLQKYGLT